jgi:hypothetical protein
MVTYMPILKARPGEFQAVGFLQPELVPAVVPVFEVIKNDSDPARDTLRFGELVREWFPRRAPTIAVDVGQLSDLPPARLGHLESIANELSCQGYEMLPVVRPDDSTERLAAARSAANLHTGRAVLRLSCDDTADARIEQLGERLHTYMGLPTEQFDLLLDASSVTTENHVTRMEPLVRKGVMVASRFPWHSVTVASGAMPLAMPSGPNTMVSRLPRWDLTLWRRLRDLDVQYSDYGVGHPTPPRGSRHPRPNIRYTTDDAWWIYRWPTDTHLADAVHELCRMVVAADHWPADGARFSWGDAQIFQRTLRPGRPGNATSWRAWATSHHIAHVVAQLAGQR